MGGCTGHGAELRVGSLLSSYWSRIFCFCCVLYCRLAGSGASRQFSCLCLLSHWRSAGITGIHYHIWHLLTIWQGSNPGLQASTANTFSHLAISLALFFSLLPSLPLPFICLLVQGLSKQTMLASSVQFFCLPLTPKQWGYSYKPPHLDHVLFFQSFFFLDKIILGWNIFITLISLNMVGFYKPLFFWWLNKNC